LGASSGVALAGIDSLNIDDTADRRRAAHAILLGAGTARSRIPVSRRAVACSRIPHKSWGRPPLPGPKAPR
jgi:hypothetical protein